MTTQNREILEPAVTRANLGWATVGPIEECRAALHKKAFRVSHSIAGNPLFAVDTLIAVAKQAAKRPGDLYFDAGDVSVTDKWGKIPIPELPISEVIRRIETANAWIIMKHVEIDPRYKA